MTLGPGIEPAQHWWKTSALATVPPLLPMTVCNYALQLVTCTCTVYTKTANWKSKRLIFHCKVLLMITGHFSHNKYIVL